MRNIVLFFRVCLFLVLCFLIIDMIFSKEKEKQRVISKIEKIIHKEGLYYYPTKIDQYIEILEGHYKIELKHLKKIRFYPLSKDLLEVVCDHNKTGYVILACIKNDEVVYILNSRVGLCDTELHELAHAAVSNKKEYGVLTGIMNSLHKDEFLKPTDYRKGVLGTIDRICLGQEFKL